MRYKDIGLVSDSTLISINESCIEISEMILDYFKNKGVKK